MLARALVSGTGDRKTYVAIVFICQLLSFFCQAQPQPQLSWAEFSYKQCKKGVYTPLAVGGHRKFPPQRTPLTPLGGMGQGGGGFWIFIDFWSKGHFKVIKGRKRSKNDHFSTFSDFYDQQLILKVFSVSFQKYNRFQRQRSLEVARGHQRSKYESCWIQLIKVSFERKCAPKQGAAQNELLELLELPFLKVVNVSVNLFLKAFFYKILQYSAAKR